MSEIAIKFVFWLKPNIDAIAWGGRIHTRIGYVLPKPLLAHEKVHLHQQSACKHWWLVKYLCSKKFRLSQEIPAHIAQILAGDDAVVVAYNLANNYGFDITQKEAIKLLEQELWQHLTTTKRI